MLCEYVSYLYMEILSATAVVEILLTRENEGSEAL